MQLSEDEIDSVLLGLVIIAAIFFYHYGPVM